MNIDDLKTPSNSLTAADLDNAEVTLTIKGYTVKEFDQESEAGERYKAKKPIFTFRETEKTLVCNKTNRNAIAYAYGKEMDEWVGKQIVLYPTVVPFGKKEVEAIRVRPVPKEGAVKPKFLREEDPLDDEIPF